MIGHLKLAQGTGFHIRTASGWGVEGVWGSTASHPCFLVIKSDTFLTLVTFILEAYGVSLTRETELWRFLSKAIWTVNETIYG